MSKVTTLKCDFCNRDELQMTGGIYRHKVKREHYGYDTFGWYKVDICIDCLTEIRHKVREKKE